MIANAEKNTLLARARSLASQLAAQGVDRTDLRRMVRYLTRVRDFDALRRLMAAPPPRQTDSMRVAWEKLRRALDVEAAACRAIPVQDTGGTLAAHVAGDRLVERLIYVWGWAARLHAAVAPRGSAWGSRR